MEGVRTACDGSLFIPRSNPDLEAKLDEMFLRKPNTLRWYPFKRDAKHLVPDPVFNKSNCYIIGKGPSLDSVEKSLFAPEAPIVCVNQSIHAIEALGLDNPIYCIQQDKGLKGLCQPKSARLWVPYNVKEYYLTYDNYRVFTVEEYGQPGMYTASLAIGIVQAFGANSITMVGFDACINGKVNYADCIDLPLKGDGTRFIKACVEFKRVAKIPLYYHTVI